MNRSKTTIPILLVAVGGVCLWASTRRSPAPAPANAAAAGSELTPTFEDLAAEAVGERFEFEHDGVKVKRWIRSDFFEHQATGKSTPSTLKMFAVHATPGFNCDRSKIGDRGQAELARVSDTYWPAFDMMEASPGPKRIGVVESEGRISIAKTTFTFDEATGAATCRVEIRKKGG